MNVRKVHDFVNVYSTVLNLDDKNRTILTELMENIITKYEQIIPPIPVRLDNSSLYLIKPSNNQYSVEDFFLNRLMRNILNVEVVKFDDSTKGKFTAHYHELTLNPTAMDKQLEKYAKYFGSAYAQVKKTAEKKVIMHEFCHGLQTVYDDKIWFGRTNYKKISDELKKYSQYRGIIKKYEDIPSEQITPDADYISNGVHYSSRAALMGIKTYRNVEGWDNLNEILNESESLEIANQNTFLFRKFGNDGNYFKLRNPESSNSDITNYGDMFKTLLPAKTVFRMMYLNPSDGFESFNSRYNEIFQSEYQSDKDAIELFIAAITKIKDNNKEEDHLKLNEVLAKCLEKKVGKQFNNLDITNEQLLDDIAVFENMSVSNANPTVHANLAHVQILNGLQQKIKERNLPLNAVEEKKGIKDISFEQLKDYYSKYELVMDEKENILTKDRKTGELITDPNICTIANFANIWAIAAGTRIGGIYEEYAFGDEAKYTYEYMKIQCKKQLINSGKISPMEIYNSVQELNHGTSKEIVSGLLGSPLQPQIVNDFFKLGTTNAKPYDGKIDEFIFYGKTKKVPNYVGEIETLTIDETPANSATSDKKTSESVDDWEDREHMLMAREMAALRSQAETDENMELWEHMLDARHLEVTNSEIQSAIEKAEREFKLSNMSEDELASYFVSEIKKTTDPERLGELRREMLAHRIKDSDDTTKSSDSSFSGPHLAQTPVVPNKQKGNNIQQSQNNSGKQNGQSQFYNYSNNQSSRRFDDSSSKKKEEQRPKTQTSNDNDLRNAEYNKQNEERRRQMLMNELMRFGREELQYYLQHEQDVQKRNEFSLMLSEIEDRKKQQALDEQKQNSSQSHYHGIGR